MGFAWSCMLIKVKVVWFQLQYSFSFLNILADHGRKMSNYSGVVGLVSSIYVLVVKFSLQGSIAFM